MQRWNDVSDIPADFGPSVVTLGNFDGVHAGHRAVLGRALEAARGAGAQAVAVTFDPHPLQVLHPDSAPELITGELDRPPPPTFNQSDVLNLLRSTSASR